MIKRLIKILLIILFIVILSGLYLSFVGVKTKNLMKTLKVES